MKKLLALLAVLGMVNVASAALTATSAGTASRVVGGVTYNYDKYFVAFDGTGLGVNAIDLKVQSPGAENNIGVAFSTSTGFGLTSTTAEDPDTFETVLTPTIGRSAIDVLSIAQYNVGTMTASPTPAASGYKFVNSMQAAFAQAAPFTKLNLAGVNGATVDGQLATIYLLQGTSATATLLGGSGDGAKSAMGTVNLPEPATMGLLAIGALGLIRRKLA